MEKIPKAYYHRLWFIMTERPTWGAVLWVLAIGGIAAIQLVDYLSFDFNLILGLLILPIIGEIREVGKYSWRYAWGAVLCLCIYTFVHMQVFFMLGVGMCLFWIIESRIGKIGFLPLIWLGLISPVTKYLVATFSFPLRLQMSEWVAKSFQFVGLNLSVSGNMFNWEGFQFAVDPVCMGLNSLITACIIVTLFIAIKEREHQKNTPLWLLLIFYLATYVLALISNFFRIACLVFFRSMPETLSHELIGLICLGMYVVFPMYILVAFAFQQIKWPEEEIKDVHISLSKLTFPLKFVFIHIQLHLKKILKNKIGRKIVSTGFFLFIGLLVWKKDIFRQEIPQARLVEAKISGLEKEELMNGIAQYSSSELLIYIKPPTRFWGSSHNPEICWKGSGYTFSHIWEEDVCGEQIFVAKLEQANEETLYTAWWFENDHMRTHEQWKWRSEMASGAAPFCLINLTSTTEEKLLTYCEEWMESTVEGWQSSIGSSQLGKRY